GFDALEFDRYTEFNLLSRELAEAATDVRTMFADFGHLHGEITGQVLRQVRIASEVEGKLMRLRMVPLSRSPRSSSGPPGPPPRPLRRRPTSSSSGNERASTRRCSRPWPIPSCTSCGTPSTTGWSRPKCGSHSGRTHRGP